MTFTLSNRQEFVQKIKDVVLWDIVVIGGGATGLGVAVDAASRGYKTILFEQSDFAKGTSSRSTKLIHGGVRYLAQGNIKLVYEALHERGLLLKNAASIVTVQSFIIPCYSWTELLTYALGMRFYDLLAGKRSMGRSKFISKEQLLNYLPTLNLEKIRGGIQYFDGQFDDALLASTLAEVAAAHDAVVLNYFAVRNLIKKENTTEGVEVEDLESGQIFKIRSKTVINATGVFVNEILKLDDKETGPIVSPSQGIHLVLNREFLSGEHALMIPKTDDGRVLFAVPWKTKLLVGTTDTPVNQTSLEPKALETEIEFILRNIEKYLIKKPQRSDVLSVFAGLRPLAADKNKAGKTKEISRSHKILISASGLMSIIGGKWTTYRKMAEDVVDQAIKVGKLPKYKCKTKNMQLNGKNNEQYAEIIKTILKENPAWSKRLDESLPYIEAEVIAAARYYAARTIEDVLARRTRTLFLDANAAIEVADTVAGLMAAELNKTDGWKKAQIEEFATVARNYLINK